MGSMGHESESGEEEVVKKHLPDPSADLEEEKDEDEADDSEDENQNVFYKSSELIVSICINN